MHHIPYTWSELLFFLGLIGVFWFVAEMENWIHFRAYQAKKQKRKGQ